MMYLWTKRSRILLDSDYIMNIWINKDMTKCKIKCSNKTDYILTLLGYNITKILIFLFFFINIIYCYFYILLIY